MKFNYTYSNTSKFDKDILWFVAQDIEHLKTLHSNTNKEVKINKIEKDENTNNLYKSIQYSTWRKILNFITVKVETSRKIIGDKIIYIEQHKYLNTIIKNTHIIEKKENHHVLIDDIEIDTPLLIFLFSPIIKFLINKHLNAQFAEDEIFRERLQIVKNKTGNLKKYIWLDID